ncbi:MAG TPA: DUF3800 domain-containing protein [Candidatus Acidoferrales bacterium]
MGQSKIPLYAYVDETGNTGHNLFDEAQPDFFTAALITKGNFDDGHGKAALALTGSLGVDSLHGKELGVERIEKIADGFLALLSTAQAHFFISRVEKKYLLASKLFDSFFDSGENAGVAWHHYNLRPMRLLLVFKLALAIDLETARLFWQCILEPNETKAYEMLPGICARLHGNLLEVPDHKSREILGEGLEWARLHPRAIQIHTDRKLSRQAHFPNLVAFANLLDGLDHFAKQYKKRVARITHDQQTEFEKSLAAFHELFTTVAPDQIRWAGETFSLQKVVGSEFEVKADEKSAGIQVTDVVLWLYGQLRKQRELPTKCMAIVHYALMHGWESDFSFSGVDRMMQERYGAIFNTPITAEQEAQARQLLAKAEQNRLASMAQYEQDQLPPFMRELATKTSMT